MIGRRLLSALKGCFQWLVVVAAVLFAPSMWPSASAAEIVQGVASVIDGDTININRRRIRLHGIDAPESAQTCTRPTGRYRCGAEAALALSDLVGRKTVRCEAVDQDRYGRLVAICRLAETDLSRWMVSSGHALAYRRYSDDYVSAEMEAQRARRGIWAGEFQPPWDWRREARRS